MRSLLVAVLLAVPSAAQTSATGRGVPFVENAGQWPPEVRFAVPGNGAWTLVRDDGLTVVLSADGLFGEQTSHAAVSFRFEGADPQARFETESARATRFHFLQGPKPSTWHSEVGTASRLRAREILPGVDLVLRQDGGRLAYDLWLAAGSALSSVVVRAEGAERLSIDPSGALVAETGLGPIRQEPPRSWVVAEGGARRPVASRFRLLGGDRFGFEAPARALDEALLVDPGLVFSTFAGIGFGDGVASGPGNASYLFAYVGIAPLQPTPGAFDTTFNGTLDGLVASFVPDGSALQFATFLGGPGDDEAYTGQVDASGCVYAGGLATTGFPTTWGSYAGAPNGSGDCFVAKLNATGSALLWSAVVGGANDVERCFDLAIDGVGSAYFTGQTWSLDFPITPGAFGGTAPPANAFVVRLTPGGDALVYSAMLGGSDSYEAGFSIAVDAAGNALAVGRTSSINFPVTPGALDPTYGGQITGGASDVFITKLRPDGKSAVFSTYFGGQAGDTAYGVAVGPLGLIHVAGSTFSSDLPTTPNVLGPIPFGVGGPFGDFADGFVLCLDPRGTLVWSTYLGSSGSDGLGKLAITVDGAITLEGGTTSGSFPTTLDAFDSVFHGLIDAVVTRVNPTGSGIIYSTYLGGNGSGTTIAGWDEITALALDSVGNAVVAGWTHSPDFPTTPGSFQPTYVPPPVATSPTVFLAKLSLPDQPVGLSTYGTGLDGCSGPHWLGANGSPRVGDAGFRLVCSKAPPSSLGLALVSDVASATGSDPFGIGVPLWVDLFGASEVLALDFLSDAWGNAWAPAPIPATPALAGKHYFVQALWAWPSGPCAPSVFGLSISRGLELVIQP